VKLTQIATVYTGTGLYAMGLYIMLRATAMQAYEPHEVWRRVDALRPGGIPPVEGEART
jgi:hypothetical protein